MDACCTLLVIICCTLVVACYTLFIVRCTLHFACCTLVIVCCTWVLWGGVALCLFLVARWSLVVVGADRILTDIDAQVTWESKPEPLFLICIFFHHHHHFQDYRHYQNNHYNCYHQSQRICNSVANCWRRHHCISDATYLELRTTQSLRIWARGISCKRFSLIVKETIINCKKIIAPATPPHR